MFGDVLHVYMMYLPVQAPCLSAMNNKLVALELDCKRQC